MLPTAERSPDIVPVPGVVRLMLDTNIADQLVENPALLALLADEVQHGRLHLLVTHLQVDEVMATPDNAKRDSLAQVLAVLPAARVLTYGAAWDISRFDNAMLCSDETAALIAELTAGNTGHMVDALIVVTAAWFHAAVVSEDKRIPAMARRAGVHSFTVHQLRQLVGGPDDEHPGG